jgi:hypothetical protein
MAVNRERERLEAWDATACEAREAGSIHTGEWRRERMARDHEGYLRRAKEAAQRAAVLARAPEEAHRTAEHLARIEHELGNHTQELLQAQRMMALDSDDELSRVTWRRAAECNGLASPKRSASVAASAVPPSPVARGEKPANESPASVVPPGLVSTVSSTSQR